MAKMAHKYHTPNRFRHVLPDSTRGAAAKAADLRRKAERAAVGRGVLPEVPAEDAAEVVSL